MAEIKIEQLTPMMRQYFEVKQQYPDTLVFYRLGDFYELFFDDAKIVSNLLDLTLTRRGSHGGEPVPMAGVPFQSADNYIARLLKFGRSVVICDQMSDKQSAGRNMIERKVTRIITPGTATEEGMIPDNQDNILAAVYSDKLNFGFATLNLSTGRFSATEVSNINDLMMLIDKISPAELLYPERFSHYSNLEHIFCRKALPLWDYDYDSAYQSLCSQFKTKSLLGFGVDKLHAGLCAAGALLNYVKTTQNVNIEHVTSIYHEQNSAIVLLDKNAQRNLELLANLKGEAKGSLLHVLNKTCTPMGSRLLRNMLINPLRNNIELEQRLDLVEALIDCPNSEEITHLLDEIGDLERIVARIGLRSAKPRDLSKLRDSLGLLPQLKHLLTTSWQVPTNSDATSTDAAATSAAAAASDVANAADAADDDSNNKGESKVARYATLLQAKAELFPELDTEYNLLKQAIDDFPSLMLREGGVIADGFSAELDELRDLQNGSEKTIMDIENREKERTGISTLKVRFNNVHGYYIEVSKSASERVPQDYVRRQTLKNSERYITTELKTLEEKTLSAQTRCLQLEKELFESVVEQLILSLPSLSAFAHNAALLDVSLSLARVAKTNHYVRPKLNSDNYIKIVAGRHPVVEYLNKTPFISNGVELSESRNLAVISGPNMGGKSTFMRQTALIAIMARMGSFVPANEAIIGDIDRIFTRIGASDDLASGRSTFMVEMEETATILNNASKKSLVIMDEVGRGTSGAEGAALAEAIVQYLAKELRPKTMFSTHYTEVTALVENYPNAFNICFNAKEFQNKIVFLYHAEPGRQERSFGIEVAQLAGIPTKITKRAMGFFHARAKDLDSVNLFTPPLLATATVDMGMGMDDSNDGVDSANRTGVTSGTELQSSNANVGNDDALNKALQDSYQHISVLEAQVLEQKAQVVSLQHDLNARQELVDRIATLDLNALTPLEALNTLSQLKELLRKPQ